MLLVVRLILKIGVIAELLFGGVRFVRAIFRKIGSKEKPKLTGDAPTKAHELPGSIAMPEEEDIVDIPVPEIIEDYGLVSSRTTTISLGNPVALGYVPEDAHQQLSNIVLALGLDEKDVGFREAQISAIKDALARLNLTPDTCVEGVQALISSLAFNREDAQKLRAQVITLKSRLDALRTVLVIVKEDYIVRDAGAAGFSILSGEALKRRKHLIQSVLKEEFFHQLGIGEEVPEVGLVFEVDFHPEGLFLTAHIAPGTKVEFNSEGLGLYREVDQALSAVGFSPMELTGGSTDGAPAVYYGSLSSLEAQKVFISDLEKHKLIRLYYALKAWGNPSLLVFN